MITKATGREPYFVGKPNPMMFRSALNRIEAHSESTMMVGDRMDTDVVAGIEAGLDTILVLTGSTTVADIERVSIPSRSRAGLHRRLHRTHLIPVEVRSPTTMTSDPAETTRRVELGDRSILAEEVKNEIYDGATPYSTYVRGVIVDGDRGVLLTGTGDSALVIER